MLNRQSILRLDPRSILQPNAKAIAKLSLGSILALMVINPAASQITPNGAGTVVNRQGNQINITGGTQSGANLFHSFRDFHVNSSQIANFLSNPQTQNILARINGGNPSLINGLLQVSGGNSNLFLMNPAGIVFGQGASLNVTASFTATTANQIGFGNNLFNAFGDNNFSALTGNPDSFLFTTNQSGSIVNAGNLAVGNGQNISLIAGNTINTDRLTAPGGEIQVLAVPGTNRVRLSQPGQVLSLEIVPPVDGNFRAIDLPALLTGNDLPGIQVNPTGQIQVAGTSLPNQQGMAVASGTIDVSNMTGNGGTVQILGDTVAALKSRINANGATGGGTVRLGGEYLGGRDTGIAPALRFNSQRTLVDRNSLIRANATVSGEGGRVIVWANQNTGYFGRITGRGATGRGGFVEVSGRENLAFDGRVEIPGFNGLGGTLLLDPTNITISAVGTDDGQLADATILVGDTPANMFISAAALAAIAPTTAINITASGNIDFQSSVNFSGGVGAAPVTFNAATISSLGTFDLNTSSRNINILANSINAPNLNIFTNSAFAAPGNIQITANTGNVVFGTLQTINNLGFNAGTITLNAPQGQITTNNIHAYNDTGNGAAINLNALGNIAVGNVLSYGTNGNAGAINFTSQGNITTGVIGAATFTSGNGGAVILNAQGNISTGDIQTNANASGSGGNINLTSQGNITTGRVTSFAGSSDGGAVNFNAQGSITTDIIATYTNTGNAGTVSLVSQGNNISTGDIGTTTTTGDGGAVSLNALQGNITPGNITTNTSNGNAGNITFNAPQGGINTSQIGARSLTAGNGGAIDFRAQGNILNNQMANTANNGNAGTVTLNTSQGNVTIGDIDSVSFTNGSGGAVSINAPQGNITTGTLGAVAGGVGNGGAINFAARGNILVDRLRSDSENGNGAAINLNAATGNLTVSSLRSNGTGVGNASGAINLNAGNLVRFIGSIGFACPFGQSICSGGAGGASSGGITIRHNGGTTIPFIVGDSATNGTGSVIDAGAGSVINSSPTFSVPPGTYTQGLVQIISTPLPVAPLVVPPVIPPATPPITSPALVSLLQTPAPPPTPAPVVVGTPEPAPVPVPIASPLPSPSPVAIASPLLPPAPPPLPSPPPLVNPNPITNSITTPPGISPSLFASLPPTLQSFLNEGSVGSLSLFQNATASLSLFQNEVTPSSLFQNAIENVTPDSQSSSFSSFSNPPTVTSMSSAEASARVGGLEGSFQNDFNQYLGRSQAPDSSQSRFANADQPTSGNSRFANADQPTNSANSSSASSNPQNAQGANRPPANSPNSIDADRQTESGNSNQPTGLANSNQQANSANSTNSTNSNSQDSQNSSQSTNSANSGQSLNLTNPSQQQDSASSDKPKEEVNAEANAQYNLQDTQAKLNLIAEATEATPALVYVFFAPDDRANNFNSANLAFQTNRVARDNDTLEVILISGKGAPLRVQFPNLSRRQVIEVANNFRSEVTNFRNPRGFLNPAKQMYQWILAPLEAELQKRDINNLVFLMDTGLRSIPLAALHDGKGFAIERYSVGLMPSLNLTPPNHIPLDGSQVLAMGATTFTSSGLSPLPAVSLEVNTVSQLWQGSEFLNDRFTLNNLIQQRQNRPFRMIHLATHAVFSPGDRANSYIQLWDRKLSLDQLEQLDLGNPPVDLLVLSACQTALGDRDAELGFASLAINAGVRTALASLWQVNDAATLGLMTKFYQQLQVTTTKAEALRQAQLGMLRGEVRLENGNLVTPDGMIPLTEELKELGNLRLNHPYYWSAFTLVGNPW